MAGGEANVRRKSSTLSQDSSLFSVGLLGGDSRGEIIAQVKPQLRCRGKPGEGPQPGVGIRY